MQRFIRHLKILTVLSVVLGGGLLLVVLGMAGRVLQPTPALVVKSGLVSSLTAQSAYVFDATTGQPLFVKDPDAPHPLASVTKLLASAMFYTHASHTASTTITAGDVATEGRAGRLQAGQVYQNEVLLFPTLLESSNDAAAALARVSPVPLVDTMNAYAARHGLLHTHFVDSSGLRSGDVSTARELGMLANDIRRDYPHIFDITRLPLYFNHINAWLNNNPFVHEAGYLGGKHGYTDAAAFTDVAFFKETLASGQTRTIGYVILYSHDLAADMHSLRSYVHDNVLWQ